MSNILYDNGKPDFDISNWSEYFIQKGYPVPENEMHFREIMSNKNMSVMFISDAVRSAANWDNDELEEECPDKTSKIDKFLELYHVIFPSAEVPETVSQEVPAEESRTEQQPERSTPVLELDAESVSREDAQDFLDMNHSGLVKDVDGKINVKAPVIYENMSVTVNSRFKIKYSLPNISRNNVFILDDALENVIAVGRIINKEGSDLVTMEKADIDFSAFRDRTQFNIAVLKTNKDTLTGEIIYKPVKIQMHVMETTERVLCIDFGTSNTTAGSYRIKDEFGSEPELVTFADVTQQNRLVNFFPTVVYVENCEDKNHIVYKFGFEAKAIEKKLNYESSASVFYEIKHWLIEDSYYPETITLFDSKGNTTTVSKKDVVSAYLKHIISLSEDYFGVKFKELHFTAPVKMKYKFINVMREILSDYNIIEDGIDEAGAILFDYVADKFIKWDRADEKARDSGNVAVIDCGGGTTDLATCKYSFCENKDNTQIKCIEMNTQFTSGDFNYGGNNITYRIMQLIKLKIALKYGFITPESLNKVMERSENDILLEADIKDYNNDLLYSEYISLYEKCEEFIPTKFEEMSEDFFDDDKPKIKRNFYYLWQFAEQVKIIFYREEKEVKKDKWDDAIQAIGDLTLNYLYKKENDVLIRLEAPLDNLEITITEIRKVIFGDIYSLLNRILNLENGLPKTVYDYYRLSGQSCKINLFNELMKEFIAGKILRAGMDTNVEHIESISLKKHCIDGSIRYIMYKKLNMRAELVSVPDVAERIYTLYFADLIGELPTEDKNDKSLRFYPVKSELDEITVVVRDNVKVIRKVNISAKNAGLVDKYPNPDEAIKKLKNGNDFINWEGTIEKLADFKLDGRDGEVVFIVAVPAGNCDGYGFYVHYIKKIIRGTEETYRVTDGRYYNYEAADSGFFDGRR